MNWKDVDPAMKELVIDQLVDHFVAMDRDACSARQRGLNARAERMDQAAEAFGAAVGALGYNGVAFKKYSLEGEAIVWSVRQADADCTEEP